MKLGYACLVVGAVVGAGGMQAWAAGDCGALAKLQIENTTISEAIAVAGGTPYPFSSGFGPAVVLTSLPAHCLVHGEVNHHKAADGQEYGDKFEVRLPVEWGGRFLFEGGGGLDGIVKPAIALQGAEVTPESKSALSLGYVVATSDGGHADHGPFAMDAAFGADPESRIDYNYRSTKLVTDVARKLMAAFYGSGAKHSYFQGCSNGGREGLQMVERYPDEFDGVIVGAPAFNLSNAAIAEAWNTDEIAKISPKKADGTPDLAQGLTEADLKLLVAGVLDKCDALDGLKDGLIENPEACHFDPAVLECGAGKTDGCLSAAKVKVVKDIFAGPRDSAGKAIYHSWQYDSGDSADGWRVWMTGNQMMPSINVLIFPSFFNGLALRGVGPKIDIFHFDFDKDPARIAKSAEEINAINADWSGFRKHGGKVLLYTGVSDPVFSALDLIRFYKEVKAANGGEQGNFTRLYLAPGMNHCSGGPGLDNFDTLGAMQGWVEEGKAPGSLIATGKTFPGRSRPLCAYPLVAKYPGTGDTESAASFRCEKP